ncbi:hypothetical protein FRC12_009093 [Ceratobasidium sp. 428]|nr:hypothetical protein FRC12_009093 [Ceratobasidium sp. 428]
MSGSSTHTDKPTSPYYVAIYKGHSVAIRRDADYEATIKLVQNAIPKLRTVDPHDVFISTILPDYGDLSVQISKDIWSDVVEHIKNADIKLSEDLSFDAVTSVTPNEETIATASQTNSPQAHQASPESLDPISITIYTAALKVLKFDDISPSITIEELKERIETTYKVPFALQDLILRGTRLKDHKTLAQCSVTTTTSLALIVRWRKPMIYLSAPHKIIKKKINIQIALNRAWESAALGVSFGEAANRVFTISLLGY